MNDKNNNFGFSTRAIHYGYNAHENNGAVIPPVYMTSTFAFATAEYGAGCLAGEKKGIFIPVFPTPPWPCWKHAWQRWKTAKPG